jgi:ribonuclease BN (tRNA processing enzyme)
MKKNNLRVKIYGVRGSYPLTVAGNTQFGVNTTSLRFDIGKHVVVFDAGTGIINLGSDLFAELKTGNTHQNLFKIHLLFTHTHIDHLMGFPYFSMIYHPQCELNVIAPTILNTPVKEAIEKIMSPEIFPVTLPELGCSFNYLEFGENRILYFFEESFQIIRTAENDTVDHNWIARISCIRNYTHPRGGCYIYKIETNNGNSVVLATDIEGFIGLDQRLVNFANRANILIHDAQYTPQEYQMFQGYGHSTYEMACQVAKKARVGKLLLFHHDPKHSDEKLLEIEQKAKDIFSESYLASESMEFEFL